MDITIVVNKVSRADLAQAFTGKPAPKAPVKNTKEDKKDKKPRKFIVSVVVFAIGLIALIAGVVVLVLKYADGEKIADGEYLFSASEWALKSNTNCVEPDAASEENAEGEKLITNCESADAVIWKFTEIGKGTLTTNSHVNDYDFIWAIEDGKLKIETKWLYDIVNEYEYTLDQNKGILTLIDGEKAFVLEGKFAKNQ